MQLDNASANQNVDLDSSRAASLESRAIQCDQAAYELEIAIRHLQTAARHFREGEIPRGCAHVLAAYGHENKASAAINELAVIHALRSVP